MKLYSILVLLFMPIITFGQIKVKYPANVRYIAGGYENRHPYFNSLESALNSVISSCTPQNPYVFWLDSDTTQIKDWKRGRESGKLAMVDSINSYFIASGKIKWAGFGFSGGPSGAGSAPVLYLPDGKTIHYNYPRWHYNLYGSWYDSLSRALDLIDKDMNELIVYTDTSWLYVENDTLKFRAEKVTQMLKGRNAFTGTAASDTILIEGASVNDIYFVSPIGPCPQCSSNDVLRAEAVSNKLIVWRNTSGTPNLQYYWMRVRP